MNFLLDGFLFVIKKSSAMYIFAGSLVSFREIGEGFFDKSCGFKCLYVAFICCAYKVGDGTFI